MQSLYSLMPRALLRCKGACMHMQTLINTHTETQLAPEHHLLSQPGTRSRREAAHHQLIWTPDAPEAPQQIHQAAVGKTLGRNPRKIDSTSPPPTIRNDQLGYGIK